MFEVSAVFNQEKKAQLNIKFWVIVFCFFIQTPTSSSNCLLLTEPSKGLTQSSRHQLFRETLPQHHIICRFRHFLEGSELPRPNPEQELSTLLTDERCTLINNLHRGVRKESPSGGTPRKPLLKRGNYGRQEWKQTGEPVLGRGSEFLLSKETFRF